ncbi:hypothetical protein [Butyrivibrio sp. M55]|uniref:hypothetical protein n=1 Tax=Butyrivibrio sp. M55 TaxID=1855323 RepID=UPI0008E54644|nr:hypothetical protein [Butyrivibrio sp. M55]SFU88168.1 hypothetical protein SAMN05216540_11662 [Butyrivibrio sp. M55]
MQKYEIEKVNCSSIVEKLNKEKQTYKDEVVVKRGLLGKIVILQFDSYEKFCCFFEDVSNNCREVVKKHNCKRVLFLVMVESMSENILKQQQKILMFDKEFNLESVSYEVLFIDRNTNIGYFGGMNEKGKTFMYKDTLKMLVDNSLKK